MCKADCVLFLLKEGKQDYCLAVIGNVSEFKYE